MKRLFAFLVDCGLVIYILFVSFVIIFFLTELFNEIIELHYNYLQYEEFGWVGLVLLPFAFLELLALQYFFRKLKKKIASGPHGWR